MSEETKVDKDYLEAFNLGYELAKELSLKSPMFNDMNFGNDRIIAMQAGMIECGKEIKIEKLDRKNISKNKLTDFYFNSLKDKGIEDDNGIDLSF
ncbi:hypothetical protein LCGC14_1398980 [marine sediment metagenome]|uniref:Uncharacterized protein n=2 Tax=root TaxID=1 RepID=A0A831VX49_9FLAO|nr:hypothetical protein [Pricia antarctica]